MCVALIQHPLDHGPGHHRETRHEMVIAHREAGDLVVRVRNDTRAHWKFAHLEALRRNHHVGARADRRLRVGVQRQVHARRFRGALAGMIVGCRADAAEAKDDVSRRHRAPERGGDQVWLVAEVVTPVEPHSAHAKDLDQLGEMLILALPANDLVADNDRPNSHLTPVLPHPRSARCAARRGARGRSE